MQRRVFLLFLLFLVLAAFYAKVTGECVPIISKEQQAQTEMLNQIDAGQEEATGKSSKN